MKRNLLTSKQNYVAIATSISKTIVITIALVFSILKTQGQITATLVSPTHFGGCIDTVFTFKYTNQTNHTDTISALLSNAANNCQSTSTRQFLMKFDSCNVVGTTATYNSDSSKIIIQVPASAFSGLIIIRYHIYIDCTILSSSSTNPDLIQTFKCSDTTFNLNISGSNTSTFYGLTAPKIVGWQNSNSFNFSYHDTTSFKLRYRNFSSDTAKVAFTYFISDTTLCGYGSVFSYQYSTDSINFFTFYPNNKTHVTIPPFTDFYIKQFVTENSCPSNCDTLKAFLSWQCNFN